jgi:hypothetical protein
MSGPRHDIEDPAALQAAVESGHEVDAVRSRLLWVAGVAFVVITLVAVVVVYVLQPLMVASQEADSPPANPLAAAYGRTEPPAPRLQVDPALDIFDHRKAEERVLSSYGWVDEKAGVVRIPIERAMGLLAERGAAATAGTGAPSAPGAQP